MSSRVTKIIKKGNRRELATRILRGDISDPRVKEILQTAPSNVKRVGFSGKEGSSGFSPSFGKLNGRMVINTFNNAPSSKSKVKTKKTQTVYQRMTRAWAENLAGRWLNEHRHDDTPYTGVC